MPWSCSNRMLPLSVAVVEMALKGEIFVKAIHIAILAFTALFFSNSAFAFVTCIAATTSVGGVSNTEYYCTDNGIYNAPPGGDTIVTAGGGSGGTGTAGTASNPIKVYIPAASTCDGEMADEYANIAFKTYWQTALKPRVSPDQNYYAILFADGQRTTYQWVNLISASYAITRKDGAICHSF